MDLVVIILLNSEIFYETAEFYILDETDMDSPVLISYLRKYMKV